jgi:hypothetical protein
MSRQALVHRAIAALLEVREELANSITESCQECDMSRVYEDPFEPINEMDQFIEKLKAMTS